MASYSDEQIRGVASGEYTVHELPRRPADGRPHRR
jgi:hypothetical protein